MKLLELAIYFRALNLYSHQAHNCCSGPTFFSDHAFFNELYDFADDKFDEVIERYIGNTNCDPDLKKVTQMSLKIIEKTGDKYFVECLNLLNYIKTLLDKTKEDKADENLIAGIDDELKVFLYKIQQRLK